MKSGESLGPYRIVETIGEGGIDEVFRAHDPRLRRTVAIKILAPRLATSDRIDRFELEARAASAPEPGRIDRAQKRAGEVIARFPSSEEVPASSGSSIACGSMSPRNGRRRERVVCWI